MDYIKELEEEVAMWKAMARKHEDRLKNNNRKWHGLRAQLVDMLKEIDKLDRDNIPKPVTVREWHRR